MFSKIKKETHKPCIYVDKNVLKVSNEVQRDIDIEDILLNHTAVYDDDKRANKGGFVPLTFATSVRTVYTNKVVQILRKSRRFTLSGITPYYNTPCYYVSLGRIELLPHRGLDLIMYLSSISLFHMVDYRSGFDDVMLHSEFQNIGIYNPNPDFVSPMVYSHVYIDDDYAEEFSKYFKTESSWVDISFAKSSSRDDNYKALIDTLLIVSKEESNDE